MRVKINGHWYYLLASKDNKKNVFDCRGNLVTEKKIIDLVFNKLGVASE